MTFKLLLAPLLIVLPLSAFSANLGTNSGGGGDPRDLKQIKADPAFEMLVTKFDEDAVQLKFDDSYLGPEGLNGVQRERYQQLKTVSNWFSYASSTLQYLELMGFPFKHPSLRALTSARAIMAMKEMTLVHGENLRMGISPVTFISHPDTYVVEVDYDRYFNFVNKETKSISYEEYQKIAVKMMTIAVHEFMVLEGLEESRTYEASTEFGKVVALMMRGDQFWRWATTHLPFFQACPSSEEKKSAYQTLWYGASADAESTRDASAGFDKLSTEPNKKNPHPLIKASLLVEGIFIMGTQFAYVDLRKHEDKVCSKK